MHHIRNMLLGISLMLFGILIYLVAMQGNSFLSILGIINALVGFCLCLYGFWHGDEE